MFLSKKIIANLLYPVPVCLELLVLGLVFLLFTRLQKLGKGLVAAGVLLLAVLSFAPVPNMMAHRLESRYLPIHSVEAVKDIRWVAVLGGANEADPRLPANSRLNPSALARLVEGIRLYRGLKDGRLILSGGPVFNAASSAEQYADAAALLGVDRADMLLVTGPKDTEDEAAAISRIVKKEPFLLVTSAVHMRRSVSLFKQRGANPIPSPADYRTARGPGTSPQDFFPDPENLETATAAWHEYLGMLWYRLKERK